MIKFETKEGKCSLTIEGNVIEFSADALLFIEAVHSAILEKNESLAQFFKNGIKDAVKDDIPFECKEEYKPKDENKWSELDEIADALKKMAEVLKK
jgi:hypothetical protein